MSVESAKTRHAQQNDLSDLQAEYAQKKKKYTRQQEEELDDLKDYYNQRKEETREEGAAAINHIRQKQGESLEALGESRKKLVARNEAQLGDIEATYRRKIAENQTKRRAELEEARENTQEKISQIEDAQNQRIEKVREDAHQEIKNVKDKFKDELTQTRSFTEKRLTAVREDNENSVKHELEKGRNAQEKLRTNLEKDYEKVNTHGQKTIAERKETQEKRYQRQEKEYEKNFEKQREEWSSREQGLNEQYQNRLHHSKKAYEQQLKTQHERFESIYDKNAAAQKEALQIQNTHLLKEQVELKKKFFKDNEKYAGKEEDPFYKLQERGNRLRENSDFYIIDAYVPEHEKDNIKVVIKNDAVSVSGKRSFKEEIDEEGRKLSTNNYQTFREQFDFEKPVITEGMTRERNGDYITFWVPKLNSFEGLRKLNKKA